MQKFVAITLIAVSLQVSPAAAADRDSWKAFDEIVRMLDAAKQCRAASTALYDSGDYAGWKQKFRRWSFCRDQLELRSYVWLTTYPPK